MSELVFTKSASLLTRSLRSLVFVYQKTVSPALRVAAPTLGCRFEPSCSNYAAEALRKQGALAGLALIVRRLLKCGPWHPGGYDPVPKRLSICIKSVLLHRSWPVCSFLPPMDKKNTFIGIALLAASGILYFSTRDAPQPPPKTPETAKTASTIPLSSSVRSEIDSNLKAPTSPAANQQKVRYVTLKNSFIAVRFTTASGAIDRIALKQHRARIDGDDPYIINSPHATPALSFVDLPGLDENARYEIVSQSATEVTFRSTLDNRLEVTRHYQLGSATGGDDYQVNHKTTFRNLSAQVFPMPRLRVSLGTISPPFPNDTGIYLNVGYYNGNKTEFIQRDALAGGGLFSKSNPLPYIKKTSIVEWASVKNQFFTTILSPDQAGSGVHIERVKINPLLPDTNRSSFGITGSVFFDLAPIPANGINTWEAGFFAGPKEYRRLSNSDNFHHKEEKIMEFGASFFNKIFLSGFFAPLLLTIMTWVHSWIPNWGLAIVVMTLLLKFATLPFTLAASRSTKRMQKVTPLLGEVREKYKNSPAKQQQAIVKLYKENKVNPLGGCLPIFVTIPLFIGFFSILQSAVDLRFANFLWVKDLAAPDTVISFGTHTLPLLGLTHLTLNILPLLLGATMIFQTRVTPTPATDSTQGTMMKVMPLMYVAFCYNFASALSLYSTINGLFTIAQQLVINRLPEPKLTSRSFAGSTIKNVTSQKKK